MKKKLIIVFIFFNSLFLLNAQTKFNTETKQRSLSMFLETHIKKDVRVAYLINGKLASFLFLQSVNANCYNNTLVEKKIVTIEGKEYDEQLYITTKDNYQPQPISLKDIKKKYAKNKNLPCFYFIDGRIANVNEKNIILDKSNILEISCHLYDNVEENLKLNIIEIFTRSEENLKNANTLIIR